MTSSINFKTVLKPSFFSIVSPAGNGQNIANLLIFHPLKSNLIGHLGLKLYFESKQNIDWTIGAAATHVRKCSLPFAQER